MATKRVFGELELAILKLFEPKTKLTVRDVLSHLGQTDKYTTVMTVMNRLVEKDQLKRERTGQHYEYWLNEALCSPSQGLLGKLKHKLFGGKSSSLVSYLIESDEISDEDLEEMEKLIAKIKDARKS